MRKQISIRNKAISEIEKQIVKPQSRIQNIKPIFIGRNKFELKAHKYRLKRKQYRTRQLENENKEIENFQREILEKINQFQQQFAIKKKQLFKGLLPARIQQFEQLQGFFVTWLSL